MKNKYFNIVVKKISKHQNTLMHSSVLKKMIQQILDTEYSDSKAYKMMYYLRNRWYLLSLKKDQFLVKDPEKVVDEQAIIQERYWKLLHEHCKEYVDGKWFISGLKALELHLYNYDAPDVIFLMNTSKQSQEVIVAGKKVVYKTLQSHGKNLFKQLYGYTQEITILWKNLHISQLELALLESLYNVEESLMGYTTEIIKKILRKHSSTLSLEVMKVILRMGKYHASINMLYKISLGIDPMFAEKLKELIKKVSFVM